MKIFNLIEMLQGCSKRNGTAVYASNPDGQPTVNRRSRLTSYPGEMNEKEQMSSTCPRFALVLPSFCSRPDSLSLVSRQSDLDYSHRSDLRYSRATLALLSRFWKYAAMVTLLLTLACGNAWATSGTITAAASTDLGSGNTPRYVVEQAGVGRLMKNATGSSSWSLSGSALTTGSNKFALQTYNEISSIIIYGNGTGNNRTFSSMRVGTTTSNYAAASATGSGTMSSGGATNQTITITPASNIAASSYVEITLSGNINIYSVELVYASSCAATANAGADKSTTVGVGVAMAATAASSGYTGAWSIKAGSPSTDASQLSSTSSATATFTPTASGTYTLVWTVTDNSDGSCSASDEATVTVTAPTHTVTAATNNASYGTATAASGTVMEGSTTTITATPNSGYQFDHWTVSGTGASLSSTTTNPTTLTMGTADATVTAYFVEKSCPSSGTLYSAAVKEGVSSVSILASSTHLFTSSEITITGGKLSAINPQESAKNMIDGSLFKTTNNNTIFKIELDCALEAGDVITIDGKGGTKDATGDVGLWVSTSESRPGSAPACKGTSATTSLVDDLVNYTVTSSDEYIGGQVLYIHRAVGSGTQFNNINISRPVASACDWNINYITNGLKDNNPSAVWSENNCFTQVGSTNEWILENFEMPDVAGQFWVGPGSFDTHSVVADLSTIKWVYRSDKSRTSKSAVTNMTGTLNIWSDSGDDNYYTGIYPDYQITYGIDGSSGWTKVDFNHVSGTEYRTAIVTAPSGYKNNDNFKYYVGLRTKDNGNTYWGDHSSTVKMNGMSGMSSTDQAGKKGQWKMYEDSGSDNYYCSWIPVYTLTYNANGGSGAPAAQEVISDAVPCQWTLSTTQPTWADHVFLGWSTNSSASVPDAASEVADLGTPYPATGDVTLYAVWTACTGPTINSFVPTGVTDGTYPVGTALGSLTVTASAGNGGTLSYLWYQYDGGNIGAAVAAAGTNNAATYNIPNNAACVERHYYCVVSEEGCSTTRTSAISGALTLTAASLTALECNTRYTVQDMTAGGCGTLSSTSCYSAGLSANNRFEVLGDPSLQGNAGGTPEQKTNTAQTINSISFNSFMYLKGDGLNGSTEPTCRGVKFIIPSAGKLTIYYRYGDRSKLKKEGEDAVNVGTTTGGYGYDTHDVTAGTYYIYGASSGAVLIAVEYQCCTTPAAPTAFSAGSITSTGATFSITDAADAASYDIYYSTSSTAPMAGTAATTTSDSKTKEITGLTASTTYYAWVRAVCDESHKSSWVALTGSTFTTAAAEPEALVTWTMNVATDGAWGTTATSTTDGTNISSIATSHDEGDNAAKNSATAKTAMADAEVTTTDEPTKSARFTFTIASGKKVEPVKVTCQVFNVSSGSRTYKAQISDSNGHVYNSTNTLAVSAEASLTDATFNFASGLALTGNVTVKVYAWGTGSAFRMGESVKLFGEVDNYSCTALNLTRGGQENGTYTVGNYTGNPLTCTVNAGEPASYQWKQYTLGQGVGEAVNAVGSGSTTTSFTPNPASANTYFYACQVTDICGNSATTPYTGTFVFNAAVHHDVDFTLTNVVYSSGNNEGTDAATEGSAFSTVFAASSGYSLPGTITVTIGGSPATVSTDYTWNQGTGTLTIPAANVTGDITVTIVGEELEGDGCEDLVSTEAATATSLSTSVGTATLSNPSSQSKNSKAIKLNSSGYIELSPKAGKSFAAGDSLIVVVYNQATSGKTTGFKIGTDTYTASIAASSNHTFRQKLTADNIVSSKVKIERESSDGWFVSIIIKHCEDLPSCTTPTLPSLSDQERCPGSDIAAWDATATNAATITAAGEDIAYSWKKKGNDTELATTASFDLGSSATEGQAGTYVVTVTVSATGKVSQSVSAEVDLVVTPATETPSVSASKAKVYQGDEVTLTASCGSTGVTWQWYTCSNAEGASESSISGATSAAYTIASAGVPGTYYYKVKATGNGTNSCGVAEYVYTLTVSAPSECENYVWWEEGAPTGEVQASCFTFGATPTGSNGQSASMTIDGTTYNSTKRSSDWNSTIQFTVPADATATFYICGKGTGARTITLTDAESHTSTFSMTTTFGTFHSDEIGAGTWTMTTNGNLHIGMVALHVCVSSTCTDATPTATATNAVVCSGTELSITASEYEESPESIQWQKLNSSTSTWDNISGATSATYTVASAAAANAGSYRVVVTKGCARTSNTVTIAVPSAPNFGSTVPASVSVMQTLALSISTVEATDAVKYRWYKSADATWDAGDVEIGTDQTLIKAYADEAIGSPSYYVFCRAQNACGITTSSAIAVNVTAYVEEDCATKGNEGEAQFGFENTSCSQGTYSSESAWYTNSRTKYLTYTAPEGKYFDEAKVRIAVSSGEKCGYAYSTDGGTTWTYAEKTGLSSTLADVTINLTGNVNAFRIGRNLQDGGGTDWGVTSGNFYLTKACFTYINACTSTTVTPGTSSKTHTIGDAFTEPTFTLAPAAVASETLTYSSSDEDIATVDDDGTVTFQGMAGTVKITASYAGGTISATDYCASEGYYTITVSCSDEAPKVVPDGTVNMGGCNSSIVLNAKMQNGTSDFGSGTYQWFRDGEEISGATSASYTAVQAGVYTVERTGTGGCTSLSSNSATVTSETTEPEVERLVPFQYYHVDTIYRENSIMRFRHLFAVKNSGKLDGKSFKLYVSRNGGAATDVTSSNALAIWTNADGHVDTVMIDLNKLSGKYSENDELVYTCKAIDCEGNVSEVYKNTITMHVIGSKPTLALICSGADGDGTRTTKNLVVGGDFLTGYNKADLCEQTGKTSWDKNTEWGLYTRLKANYIVTPVNGYANFYKLNYEPFDILLLTDYPKASKSDAAATVLDDMADLCDYRPLLSLKAHMVSKTPSKWAAKGFTTAPVVPKNSRTRLNIVCYAHPMFSTIKEKTDHVQEDYSDQSQIVYTMLTGAGYESGKGLQGFEIDAAENFVTIGLIHYNATADDDTPSDGYVTWRSESGDRMLVAAAERQANPEARMIMFAVNCGAQSKFTETGRTVVHKCLEYLLTDATITPMADCSFTFDNGAGNPDDQATYKSKCPECTGTKGDHKWSTAANWGPDYVLRPGKDTEVKIAAPVEVDMPHAIARSARIVEGGSIEIPAGKALEIVGTIRRMDGSEISPTENSDIYIGSTSEGNGTLIFNNDKGDSKATVAMYTTAVADVANMSAATSTWQYIGTPYNDVAVARYNYYDSWLYQYDTGSEGWTVIPNGGPLVPFRGYCVTHPEANHTFWMNGTLTATTSQELAIPAGKYVVVANSWVAPIDINAITSDDMENITDKTIYFFNTGTDTEGTGGTGTAAGTYRATPINAASYTGDWQIPSMQGFYVVGGASDGTLHLDYSRHVRPSTDRSIVGNPMYAPKRKAESSEPEVAKFYFRGHRYYDRLIVLEREDFTRGYDSGWDGEAWGGNDAAPMSYVSTEGRWDAVSAVPEYEGTVIGFRAGEDNEYLIDFDYSPENEPLYLLDTENNIYTQVLTGNAYHFTTGDKASHERFILTRKSPQVTTGVGSVQGDDMQGTKARKLLIEDKMYILINGMLYDATGKIVK